MRKGLPRVDASGSGMAPMSSRRASRLRLIPRAVLNRLAHAGTRSRPASPRRILIAHHLLVGDTLLLTPLLAKLREHHPHAELVMTVRRAMLPLYASQPYGVHAVPYDPRDSAGLEALRAQRGFDLALVPGDNRYAWLAAALDARWIVAFAGDRPAYKNWMVDELAPWPDTPAAWGDIAATLIDGPPPRAYRRADWPPPACQPFDRPQPPYCVLHVEASTPLKHWGEQNWMALAAALAARGLQVVWSAGPGGGDTLARIDPAGRFMALGHRLDLAQLWNLVAAADLLVCPDTSVSHIGKLACTPTVTLYGPSSAALFGGGEFWRDAPFRPATIADFPCRDQHSLFKREIDWVQRCNRTLAECPRARCMEAIGVEQVLACLP